MTHGIEENVFKAVLRLLAYMEVHEEGSIWHGDTIRLLMQSKQGQALLLSADYNIDIVDCLLSAEECQVLPDREVLS